MKLSDGLERVGLIALPVVGPFLFAGWIWLMARWINWLQAVFLMLLYFSLPAYADHTVATSKAEIDGMPPWCCDIRDCQKADVRLLGFTQKGARILVDGKEYIVVGRSDFIDGRWQKKASGIFIAPGRTTSWCHIRGNEVRCATVKPGGGV